jgi:hypothetical protein
MLGRVPTDHEHSRRSDVGKGPQRDRSWVDAGDPLVRARKQAVDDRPPADRRTPGLEHESAEWEREKQMTGQTRPGVPDSRRPLQGRRPADRGRSHGAPLSADELPEQPGSNQG